MCLKKEGCTHCQPGEARVQATVTLAVPSYAPHCASTTPTGYTCPELTRAPARAGACDAFKLPSRSAFTK